MGSSVGEARQVFALGKGLNEFALAFARRLARLLGVAAQAQLSPVVILLALHKVVEVRVQKVARVGVCSGRTARAAPCRDTAEAQSLHEHPGLSWFSERLVRLERSRILDWGNTQAPTMFLGFQISVLFFCSSFVIVGTEASILVLYN